MYPEHDPPGGERTESQVWSKARGGIPSTTLDETEPFLFYNTSIQAGVGVPLALPSPLSLSLSKLTRESGTDFPIPTVPPGTDPDTERLIREKDEEVRAVWG